MGPCVGATFTRIGDAQVFPASLCEPAHWCQLGHSRCSECDTRERPVYGHKTQPVWTSPEWFAGLEHTCRLGGHTHLDWINKSLNHPARYLSWKPGKWQHKKKEVVWHRLWFNHLKKKSIGDSLIGWLGAKFLQAALCPGGIPRGPWSDQNSTRGHNFF